MVVDALKQAIKLIKSGKKIEARRILEPIIVSNPQNIQAWIWEIETREDATEKIKLMEACLLHNPDSALMKKGLAALKTRQEFLSTPEGSENALQAEVMVTELEAEPLAEEIDQSDKERKDQEEPRCPFCGGSLKKGALSCEFCGRDLQVTPSEPSVSTSTEHGIWYRRPWVKALAFILLFPLGCAIELADPHARKNLRILSGILLVFYLNLLSLSLYWMFTTNPTRVNPTNWFRFVTGQSATIPGTLLRVEGNIQNPGTLPLGMVEVQARVYDTDGNVLANDSRFVDSSVIQPGLPIQFQMDIPSITSPLGPSLQNRQILFYDDFSSPSSDWQHNAGEEGESTYFNNQYRITVDVANYDLWSNPGRKFEDTRIEVDATRQGGPENNRFGVQCRYRDSENYYFVVISSDGYYGIGKVVEGTQSFLRENGMLVTDKVFTGAALNHIRFDCVGSRLTLYLNDDYVDAVDDKDLVDGDIGLLAGTFDSKGTQILFDNLVVLRP